MSVKVIYRPEEREQYFRVPKSGHLTANEVAERYHDRQEFLPPAVRLNPVIQKAISDFENSLVKKELRQKAIAGQKLAARLAKKR